MNFETLVLLKIHTNDALQSARIEEAVFYFLVIIVLIYFNFNVVETSFEFHMFSDVEYSWKTFIENPLISGGNLYKNTKID